MTSPAITKSPKQTEKKSPSLSAKAAEAAASAAATSPPAPPQPSDAFSCLRVFKLADLMMKQGC